VNEVKRQSQILEQAFEVRSRGRIWEDIQVSSYLG